MTGLKSAGADDVNLAMSEEVRPLFDKVVAFIEEIVNPGSEEFYTAPGPPDLEPVINALDDPMRVSNIP